MYQTKIGGGGRITQRIFSHIGYKQFWHVQFYAWKTNTLKVSMFILGCYSKINLPWWTEYSFIQSLQYFVEELLNFKKQTFYQFINKFFLLTEWVKMCQQRVQWNFFVKMNLKSIQKMIQNSRIFVLKVLSRSFWNHVYAWESTYNIKFSKWKSKKYCPRFTRYRKQAYQ